MVNIQLIFEKLGNYSFYQFGIFMAIIIIDYF